MRDFVKFARDDAAAFDQRLPIAPEHIDIIFPRRTGGSNQGP